MQMQTLHKRWNAFDVSCVMFLNCSCAQVRDLNLSLSRCCHSLVVVWVPDYSLLKISSFSIPWFNGRWQKWRPLSPPPVISRFVRWPATLSGSCGTWPLRTRPEPHTSSLTSVAKKAETKTSLNTGCGNLKALPQLAVLFLHSSAHPMTSIPFYSPLAKKVLLLCSLCALKGGETEADTNVSRLTDWPNTHVIIAFVWRAKTALVPFFSHFQYRWKKKSSANIFQPLTPLQTGTIVFA